MNVPNKLTMARMVLTLPMVVFLTSSIPFGKTLALVTFVLASLTDYWDGRMARASAKVTTFGQLMDPLADKVLVSAAFIGFVAVHQIVPAWIVIIIISREFLITGLRLLGASRGRVLSAGKWGKHKMIWQIVVIVTIMAGLSLQEDLLPLFSLGRHAAAEFHRWFGYGSYLLSALVAVLTVASDSVYLWQSRDLYMDDL